MIEYQYYAFISYNSRDTNCGKRLHRKLEHFRMPATLCSEHGWKRTPIRPVFFAPTDIQPGGLDDELKERLRASKNLIVICSPNSAQSEWVGKEIEYFHDLGRDENIHFFIVDGVPNSGDPATECFNPIVMKLGLPEILGANIHEKIYRWSWLNRERAYVQLISKLLGVEFDTIWQRHRRQLIVKSIGWTVGILAVVTAMLLIWKNNQPFDTTVSLEEATVHNPNLPLLSDAVIKLEIGTETKTDTIVCENGTITFKNIPHKYFGEIVRLTFNCADFLPLDTMVRLKNSVTLKINRDETCYGNIDIELWNFKRGSPVANTKVYINEWETQSNSEGLVKYSVPLDHQSSKYVITVLEYNIIDTILPNANQSVAINF